MSKVKKMSQAEAVALSQKLSNYFAVRPLLFPYVAPSIAQNPFCWIEMPVSEKVRNDIACGFAIKRPILGREYEIIHSGSKV